MFSGEYLFHYRRTVKLAYPVVLSQLGHISVGVADSIMVGHTGTVPLAAVSLGNSLFSVILVLGLGLSFGMTPLIAAADGRDDKDDIASVFRHGFIINLLSGILLFALLYMLVPLLDHIDQPQEVVDYAKPYFAILLFSLVPLMLYQSYKQMAEGLSNTAPAMYISIGSNLLNILLNYLLIYGKLGFPALGIVGAAIATLISRVIMAIAIMIYVYQSPKFKSYNLRIRLQGLIREKFNKILRIGVPVSMQMVFEVSAFSIAAIMVGWLGAKELAAHQIALSMASVTYMMASGISAAVTVRVGNQLGKNDIRQLRLAGFSAFNMVLVFMFICAGIFIAGQYYLPSLYISDESVISLAGSLLVIAGFFQLSDGVQVVGLGALRGMSDVKVPTAITLIAYWVIGLPSGYVLSHYFELGVYGIWYGLLIGLSIAAVLLYYRFYTLSKTLKLQPDTTSTIIPH